MIIVSSLGCSATPVTDGMHTVLPEFSTRATVWGNDLRAIHLASTWLKKRNLEVIDSALLHSTETNHLFHHNHTFQDEQTVLQEADAHNIELVVFVDRTGDIRAPFISVKGVDSTTARILWSGVARYPKFVNAPIGHLIADLTCQALATAWGFSEPGDQPDDMCDIDP